MQGVDKLVLLWDISTGDLVAQFTGHEGTVYSLAFSREAAILASGQKPVNGYLDFSSNVSLGKAPRWFLRTPTATQELLLRSLIF